jgi:DNA-binding Xre family transcriptional regulator
MAIRFSLEAALKRANMSARELARRVGCSKDTVLAYRHGRVRKIDLDLVDAFCTHLGCAITDVLTDHKATATARPDVIPPAPHSEGAPIWPDGTPTCPVHLWGGEYLGEFLDAWSRAWALHRAGESPDGRPLGPDGTPFPALSRWDDATFDRFCGAWETAWYRG